MNLNEVFIENPVIAAIRCEKDLKSVIKSKSHIVFVLFGDLLNIADMCKVLKQNNKRVFVHIDMIDGLKGDSKGIKFLKNTECIDGIITTKSSNIKYAKQLGLQAIQRVFIIDSLSLRTGIKNIMDNGPAAVEVMPGIASKIINKIEPSVGHIPIIAGGLINDKKDVIEALGAGAVAISTTCSELWDL